MAQHRFVVTMIADLAKATKDFRDASDQVADLEQQVAQASKGSTQLSNAIFGISSSLVATASTAVAAGSVIERITIDADIALQAAGTSAAELNDAFLEASGSAAKLFKASRQLAGAGIKGAEAMKVMTQDARLLGQAMGTSTEDAAVVMADFIRATGKEAPDAVRDWISTGILLDKQARLDIGTFKQLSHEVLQNALMSGMSEKAVLQYATALQAQNVRGGEAVSVMNSMVGIFKDSLGGAEQLSAVLDGAGVSAEQFGNALPEDKIAMFMEGLGKVSGNTPEGMKYATELLQGMKIASGDAAGDLVALARSQGKYAENQFIANNAMADAAAKAKMLNDIENSLSNQTGLLWDDFKDLAFTIGQVFLPYAKLLVGALRGIIDVFKNLSPELQAVVVATGAVLGGWAMMKKVMGGIIGSTLKFIAHIANLIAAKMGDAAASKAVAAATGTQASAQAALNKGYIKQIASAYSLITAKIKLWMAYGKDATAQLASAAATNANAAAMGINTGATTANTAAKGVGWAMAIKEFAARMLNNIALGANTVATWLNTAATAIGTSTRLAAVASTVLATAANWAMSVSLWATAAAAWAATAPLWAIGAAIAALIAIGYIFYQVFFGSSFLHISEGIGEVIPSVEGLGDSFTGIFSSIGAGISSFVGAIGTAWDTVKGFFSWLGSGIASGFKAAIELITDLISGLANIIVWPFEMLMSAIDSVTGMFTAIGQAITSLAAPFMPFINLLKDAIELAKGVAESLTGSSMFHVVENTREITPSLQKLHDSFAAIGKVAAKVSDSTQLPNEMQVKIEEPLSARAAREMPAPPTSAPMGMPAMAAVGGGGGGATSGPVRVVVPVSVELDGMVLARAMHEAEVEIKNERHFNAPMHPLRGVEK